MLEQLMRLYMMSKAYNVRSPMPHLVGPPGCGKSTMVEQLADLLDVNLHIVNVSRLSPLDVEGVQMPHGMDDQMVLRMLPATYWTSLREGDILLLDEFLRGFPEVYNALLDVFTSRRVGAYRLPDVFIIGASNSVTAYDPALEDRLMHLTVPDPRSNSTEKQRLATLLVEALGLMPEMAQSIEVMSVLDHEVLPTYNLLDAFKKKGRSGSGTAKGCSLRKLIGMAQMRNVRSTYLKELIDVNNTKAQGENKFQYVFLYKAPSTRQTMDLYVKHATKLRGNPRLTPIQALNIEMNLQLLELEEARHSKEDPNADFD